MDEVLKGENVRTTDRLLYALKEFAPPSHAIEESRATTSFSLQSETLVSLSHSNFFLISHFKSVSRMQWHGSNPKSSISASARPVGYYLAVYLYTHTHTHKSHKERERKKEKKVICVVDINPAKRLRLE